MRFPDLQGWLEWQSTLHPSEIELGLERVADVWQVLHPTPLEPRVITVAGTNGKGSVVAYLTAIYEAAGYRTGCYTSPHLIHYNERIRIRSEMVTDDQICQAFEQIDRARGDRSLTYFEFGTLAALQIFSQQRLDLIILEVGLGGRLDAVNIIDPDVALITTVDIDHTDWLGDDLASIGREKAGIMRSETPAVYGGKQPPDSLIEHAQTVGARLYRPGADYSFSHSKAEWRWESNNSRRTPLPLPLLRGGYQLENAAAALMAIELLSAELPVDQQAARIGLQSATLPGRFQLFGADPLIILDVAHNPQAARALSSNLGDIYCEGRTLAVMGMLDDKRIEEVAEIISPRIDLWFVGPLDTPRAANAQRLETALIQIGVDGERVNLFDNFTRAVQDAVSSANKEDRILIFGSFFAVSEATELAL